MSTITDLIIIYEKLIFYLETHIDVLKINSDNNDKFEVAGPNDAIQG